MNILIVFFWNLCVLDKLLHCFLNLKVHLKIIKNYNHYCSWYQCYYKWHFYHYFHIVHYRWINWITWTYTHCIFPFDSKSSYGKIKIIPIDLSTPRMQTHAENCFQLYEIFFKGVKPVYARSNLYQIFLVYSERLCYLDTFAALLPRTRLLQ